MYELKSSFIVAAILLPAILFLSATSVVQAEEVAGLQSLGADAAQMTMIDSGDGLDPAFCAFLRAELLVVYPFAIVACALQPGSQGCYDLLEILFLVDFLIDRVCEESSLQGPSLPQSFN